MTTNEKRICCLFGAICLALAFALIILINRTSQIQDVVIDDHQYLQTITDARSIVFTNLNPPIIVSGITETNRGTNQTINQE